MHLVLDSNILLHYKSFEDIPWSVELGGGEVTIVLTATVLEEIDQKKDGEKGKIKNRAKKVSSRIGELILKDEKGKYPVLFLDNAFATEEEKQQYNLDRNDNRILFDVVKSGLDQEKVVIVSSDNAMLIRAKKMGFKIHQLNEKYLLKEELTEEEKELKATKAELERIKNRLPAPSLIFDVDDENCNHIRIERVTPYDIEAMVRDEMNALETRWPRKSIEDGQEFILGKIYNTLTPEKVIAYNKSREDFLKLSEEKIRLETQRDDLERRMVRISISVTNAGTAPTGKMNIFLQIPENVRVFSKGSKKSVRYDEPKTPNYNSFLNNISFGSIYIPSVKMWDLDAYYNDNKLSVASEPLTHKLKHNVFTFYVDSATCPNFPIQWYIADAELVEPVRGILNVSFVEGGE